MAPITNEAFFHGRKSSIGTSAVQLTTTSSRSKRGVLIKAAAGNTGTVYVGSSSAVTADSADTTDGFQLAAEDSLVVEMDDPSNIYLIASGSGQKVFWIGI